jgi:hypothetical protein
MSYFGTSHDGALQRDLLGEAPKNPIDTYTRVCHSIGLSSAAIAQLRKEGPSSLKTRKHLSERHSRDHLAWDLDPYEASNVLRGAFAGNIAPEKLLAAWSDQLQRHQELSLGKQHAKYLVRDVETIQLLTRLSEYLPRVLKPLNTDLVTLTRACGALLRGYTMPMRSSTAKSVWKIAPGRSQAPSLFSQCSM